MSLSETVSVSQLREKMKAMFDQVSDTRQPLRISRRNGEDMVVVPLSDYEALDETAYLLRSPANAERLEVAVTSPAADNVGFDSVEDLKNALGD